MTSTPAQCPHERRPGTTVCLHCRHEEREAARRRRRHFLSRASVVVLGLGALGVASVSVATELQSRRARETVASGIDSSGVDSSSVSGDSVAEPRPQQLTVALAASGARDVAVFTPVIPQGQSELGDGVFAVREGAKVSVHFDTPLTRTRRRDKFEAIVRATLPKVLGAPADSILARVPDGSMAAGDLVGDLTQRGVRLPPLDGWTVAIWPETRPGQDGPLVVSYRLSVLR